MSFPNLQDKENTVSQNQQVPVKRGPKVNGVRRSLVPQTVTTQMGAIDENKEKRIPAQGVNDNVPSVEKIKSVNGSNNSPAAPQVQTQNQPVELVDQQDFGHERPKVNGQPSRNATTFVVPPSE